MLFCALAPTLLRANLRAVEWVPEEGFSGISNTNNFKSSRPITMANQRDERCHSWGGELKGRVRELVFNSFKTRNSVSVVVRVPVEGGPNDGKKLWVLFISINSGALLGRSAVQYFIGDWDGKTFTSRDHRVLQGLVRLSVLGWLTRRLEI